MIRRLGLIALVLTLGLAARAPAWGQGQTTGSIRGQVVSSEGAALANAQVVARNTATGFSRGTLTDPRGRFGLLLLPPGTYSLQVQSIGFAPATLEDLRVVVNEATPVEVTLTTQAVAVEGVTVTGEQARVDARQAGVVQTVTPEQVESLPTPGRDFTDFINLSPLVSPQPGVGTGGQFSIGGARTSGTNIQIDGTDANNVFFGENRGSSRTPFAFSLESIREFQLITNGFDVEYGNYQGGVVNAVTKGGTNEFQGSVFGFFRDQALTGDDFSGQPPQDFEVQQFGLSLSGPVVRDRLHYFVSIDAQNKAQPVYALTPSVSEIPQGVVDEFTQILNAQGFPGAEQIVGTKVQEEDNLVLFGRLDWNISDAHRLTLRQNYSDFAQTNDRLSTSGNETTTRGGPFVNESWSTVVELNSVLGGNAFNTFRFQYSDEDRPRDPNTPGGYLPEIRIDDVSGFTDIFTGGDGIIFRNRLVEEKLQLIDNFTYQAGRHTFKVGTNNLLSNTVNEFFLFGNGSYRFPSLEAFRQGRPSQYSRNVRACPTGLAPNQAGESVICPELDVPIAEFSSAEWSVYAQDDWQVTDRLLVTPGIRYGGTVFRDEPAPLPALEAAFDNPFTGAAVETGIVPDFTGISPRLAFTYDLGDETERVLRGGVGLLVGRAPTVIAGNVFQTERPLLSVFCTGGSVPSFDLGELIAGERGANNPSSCVGGAAPSGRPEHTIFSSSFELPRTLKANLGYEAVLFENTRFGIDAIYSRSENNFTVRDINLRAPAFTLGIEGRPVFAPVAGYSPTSEERVDRLQNAAFDRIYYNTSEGEGRSFSLATEIDQRVREDLQFGVRYAFTRAYDNSSFSCCTSGEGFEEPTPGDPNFIGDPGDELNGNWGPSDFERRHTVVLNFLWNGPWGINASGIWRSQSGTPWTPLVDGDVNADGVDDNDRAFIGTGLRFESAEDAATLQRLLGEFECLEEQVGRIATRNSCRNPWFHSLDMRLSKELSTFGGQSAELVVDVFNVLNGLNSDWGRFMGVFGSDAELLRAEGFDRDSGQVIYSVNESFGEEGAVGFDPFQFQVQLGVRYRF